MKVNDFIVLFLCNYCYTISTRYTISTWLCQVLAVGCQQGAVWKGAASTGDVGRECLRCLTGIQGQDGRGSIWLIFPSQLTLVQKPSVACRDKQTTVILVNTGALDNWTDRHDRTLSVLKNVNTTHPNLLCIFAMIQHCAILKSPSLNQQTYCP